MDKKSIIGLVIIGAILFGFSWYNSNQQKKFNEEQAKIDSAAMASRLQLMEETAAEAPAAGAQLLPGASVAQGDSVRNAAFQQQLSASLGESLYGALQGEETFYTVENDVMVLTFSNKGGRVASVMLKDYKRYNGEPLYLFEDSTSKFDLSFFTNQQINTSRFYFAPAQPMDGTVTAGESDKNGKEIAFRLYADSTSYLEYVYTIYPDNYMIDYRIGFVGMEDKVARNQPDFLLNWETVGLQNEKGFDNENNYTTVAYMFPDDDSFEDLGMSKGTKEESINSRIKWVAFKQQFFSSIIVSEDGFQNGALKYETYAPHSGKIKKFYTQLSIPYSPQQTAYDFRFYFGPNKYNILKKYDLGIQKLVPLGGWLIGWINRWIVIPTFDFLGKYIASYGLIILLLTIFIKLLISPLTYKSYMSMAKMRVLKPEMDELAKKYPKQEDAMKKQQATMELYRKAGVNPMGGCLPLLIQFPILIAMFRFFPASIELRQKSFLWADDLSSYDSILNLPFDIPFYGNHVSLFTLLMAVSIFISSRINYNQSSSSAPQMAGMKFMMLYLMPLMMVFWFNNYSSGLSYYYLLSNIITIGQMYAFRGIVNEEELHRKMKENAKKPKKKSKFMQRYEEAMRQQQEMARQKQQPQRKR